MLFDDGSAECAGPPSLAKTLAERHHHHVAVELPPSSASAGRGGGGAPRRVRIAAFAFAPRDGWFVQWDDGAFAWRTLPRSLRARLASRAHEAAALMCSSSSVRRDQDQTDSLEDTGDTDDPMARHHRRRLPVLEPSTAPSVAPATAAGGQGARGIRCEESSPEAGARAPLVRSMSISASFGWFLVWSDGLRELGGDVPRGLRKAVAELEEEHEHELERSERQWQWERARAHELARERRHERQRECARDEGSVADAEESRHLRQAARSPNAASGNESPGAEAKVEAEMLPVLPSAVQEGGGFNKADGAVEADGQDDNAAGLGAAGAGPGNAVVDGTDSAGVRADEVGVPLGSHISASSTAAPGGSARLQQAGHRAAVGECDDARLVGEVKPELEPAKGDTRCPAFPARPPSPSLPPPLPPPPRQYRGGGGAVRDIIFGPGGGPRGSQWVARPMGSDDAHEGRPDGGGSWLLRYTPGWDLDQAEGEEGGSEEGTNAGMWLP